MQLCLHAGAKVATREDVLAVPCPPPGTLGNNHHPVSYGDMLRIVDTRIARMGLTIASEAFGLSARGQQFFGVVSIDTGIENERLAFGFRNSYNKSLGLGVCAGHHGIVCDNLAFSGDYFAVMHKNTKNAHESFRLLVLDHCDRALNRFHRMRTDFESMALVGADLHEGYALLGQMAGDGVLKPTEFSAALDNWRENQHSYGRNLWGVYNAATWGVKRTSTTTRLDSLLGIHQWWGSELTRRGIETVSVASTPRVLEVG